MQVSSGREVLYKCFVNDSVYFSCTSVVLWSKKRDDEMWTRSWVSAVFPPSPRGWRSDLSVGGACCKHPRLRLLPDSFISFSYASKLSLFSLSLFFKLLFFLTHHFLSITYPLLSDFHPLLFLPSLNLSLPSFLPPIPLIPSISPFYLCSSVVITKSPKERIHTNTLWRTKIKHGKQNKTNKKFNSMAYRCWQWKERHHG